jgi:hypothetical protein
MQGKHLIKSPEQKPARTGKNPWNNSQVVVSTGSRGTAITVVERTKKNHFRSRKVRLMYSREVIVEREGRGEKQWINLNR